MFKLNLKIAWRNLWKNKAYASINIFGLAAGLAGFIIILLYINRETGYDKWDPVLERTYMVAADFTQNGAVNKGSKIKALFADVAKQQSTSIENVSVGWLNGNAKVRTEAQASVEENLASVAMDNRFFNSYPLKAIRGRMEDVYLDKNSIAISLTNAKKLFGDKDPINQVLIQNNGLNFREQKLVVKAVWDDEKQPSYFDFDLFFPADLSVFGAEFLDRTFSTMLTLRKEAEADVAFERLNEAYIIALAKFVSKNADVNFKPSKQQALAILKEKEGITSFKLLMEPVSNLNLGTFYSTTAKQNSIYILIALATFLIIISCINYTNLALVLAQGRAKEVGVKKVLGAFKTNLVVQFFTEAAIQCALSFVFGLILAELLLPLINGLLNAQLSLFGSSDAVLVVGQAVLILIAIILLAGAYPAFVLAGFRPIRVLKGNFNSARDIGGMRKALVVLQFTIAIGLVVSFLVMYEQLTFMKQQDIGLQPSQLATLSIAKFENRKLTPERFRSIKDRLLAVKGIKSVTRATEEPINDSGFSDEISYENKTLSVESRYVDANYLSVIGGKILTGRDFSENLLATDSTQSILLNEAAYQQLGLNQNNVPQISVKNGGKLLKYNVVGKVKDIQAYGFEKPVLPTAYFAGGYEQYWRRNIILRLDTKDLTHTIADFKKAWAEIEPGSTPNLVFADETFAKMNETYETSQQIIFAFGMLTLVISFFGLIGSAAYSAKIRVKEMMLRRILGATTASLLKLLNKDFLMLVIIANVLADILAYIYMEKWFAGFAYRIDMPILVFALTNFAIILSTLIAVSVQSLKSVKSKPAEILKYE